MSEATSARRIAVPAATALLVRLSAVLVVGFLGFGVGLVAGIRSDRIAVLTLAIATGMLISTVFAVDQVRPREQRNLLLSIFSFAYGVFFVLPALVFYVRDAGYPAQDPITPIPLTPAVVSRGMFAALVAYAVLLTGYALPLGTLAANTVLGGKTGPDGPLS